MRNKDKLNFIKQIVKECDKQQLTLTDVVKSFYCECTQPSLQKPISETEYECFDCGKEVKQ